MHLLEPLSSEGLVPPASGSARRAPGWLGNESLFQRWTDPVSQVESFILKPRVAPIQQSFYFTNPSLTRDGRYYWFYCGFPPSGSGHEGRTLAVADFVLGTVTCFPETQFSEASPAVDPATGEVYWANAAGIWKRDPQKEGRTSLVNRFTPEFLRNRTVWRYATHFTFSPDRRSLNIDAEVGDDLYLGEAPLNGEEIEVWQTMKPGYNHAQFNPRFADLQLFAQDNYLDRSTWQVRPYENRLWLLRKGSPAGPVYRESISREKPFVMSTGHFAVTEARGVVDSRATHGHEWWGADGEHLWYCHYGRGVERLRMGESRPELRWAHPTVSHAHADRSGRLLVADSLPPHDPTERRVAFRRGDAEREVNIVSHMPDLHGDATRYHLHPHPQFCLDDALICYTTTVLGQADVAFTVVEDLVGRCGG